MPMYIGVRNGAGKFAKRLDAATRFETFARSISSAIELNGLRLRISFKRAFGGKGATLLSIESFGARRRAQYLTYAKET
jgi:hypothetical protein